MKTLKLITASSILIFLFACSGSSSLYESDYPLTADISRAENESLTVNIPKGWFSAEDNKENKLDLWLIKDDYSATISFIPINLDSQTEGRYGTISLNTIVEYSKLSQKLAHMNSFIDLMKNESFEMNYMQFRAYQFAGTNANSYRVVVFQLGDKYFECTAAVKPPQSPEKLKEIFSVQNAVLKSIKK